MFLWLPLQPQFSNEWVVFAILDDGLKSNISVKFYQSWWLRSLWVLKKCLTLGCHDTHSSRWMDLVWFNNFQRQPQIWLSGEYAFWRNVWQFPFRFFENQSSQWIWFAEVILKEGLIRNIPVKYRKGSCRQRNTKHSPTSHEKDTYTHTTAHTASLIHLLVKNKRETYTKQRWR